MTNDDLLREASDPTTPGERLQVLIDEARHRQLAAGRTLPDALVLQQAVLANPSVPLPLLRWALLDAVDLPRAWHAWHNPTVPLLLHADPSPSYLEAAAWLLQRQGQKLTPHAPTSLEPMSLEGLIAFWSSSHQLPVCALPVRAFARHLAGLFGLPWPGEP